MSTVPAFRVSLAVASVLSLMSVMAFSSMPVMGGGF
jgi:hypothetical protein